MAEAVAAAGIDELITRLRDEGVKAGEVESARIIKEAEAKAARILIDARREADDLREKARGEISALEQSAKSALLVAARDAMLALRSEVRKSFERYVRRLIINSTEDTDFLRSLVLILAGEAAEKHIKNKEARIYLSKAVLERESGPEMKQRSTQFLKSIATGLLREGITLVPSDELVAGARVRLVNDQIEIDLSDEMISALLIRHLTPRFREIMSGGE